MQYLENTPINCTNMVTSALFKMINSLLKIRKCLTCHPLQHNQKDTHYDLRVPPTSSLTKLPSYALAIMNYFSFVSHATSPNVLVILSA